MKILFCATSFIFEDYTQHIFSENIHIYVNIFCFSYPYTLPIQNYYKSKVSHRLSLCMAALLTEGSEGKKAKTIKMLIASGVT